MMENTTDRLFWTLASVVLGALLLTVSVKAFPAATNAAIAPMSGIIKQADTVTKNVSTAGSQATDNLSPKTNNYGQTEAQAKAAAPNIQLFSNIDPTTGITWNIMPGIDGKGVLAGITLPKGWSQSTVTIPEYINAHDFSQGNPMQVHVTTLDSGSTFGLQGDWSKVTTLVVPSSVKSVPSAFFDLLDNHYNSPLTQNLNVKIPKDGNFNPSTQKKAIEANGYYNTYNGITISATEY